MPVYCVLMVIPALKQGLFTISGTMANSFANQATVVLLETNHPFLVLPATTRILHCKATANSVLLGNSVLVPLTKYLPTVKKESYVCLELLIHKFKNVQEDFIVL